LPDDVKNASGALDAFWPRLIQAGRPRGVQVNTLGRRHAIGGHIDPTLDILFGEQARPQDMFQNGPHRAGRFAGADDRDPLNALQIILIIAYKQSFAVHANVLGNQPLWQNGSHASPPDSFDICPKFFRRRLHRI
jgi:hypothetical protein